jgi:hypothetical protein
LTELSTQMRLAFKQAGRPDQREQARWLVPAGRSDVAFGLEGGGHKGAEVGLEGAGHCSMLPHRSALGGTM